MEAPILDLSYLYEISDNDSDYLNEVINLFLESVPGRLTALEKNIKDATIENNYETIRQLSHFLKSSANIIRIKGMYENLTRIELLARQATGKPEMTVLIDDIMSCYNEAMPLILQNKRP